MRTRSTQRQVSRNEASGVDDTPTTRAVSAPLTTSRNVSASYRRLLVGFAVLMGLLTLTLPTSGFAGATPGDSARSGANWLSDQLAAGVPLQMFGSDNWGVTIDAATAVAAVDVTNPVVASTWSAIEAQRDVIVPSADPDVPGTLAKIILLAHAMGENPREVGTGAPADLVARLEATLQSSGLFGVQSATYDGVFRQGMSLAALGAVGIAAPPSSIDWLADQQCTNAGFEGAFMSYRSDTSVDCADDPGAWSGADTNAAALAISGLTASAKDNTVASGVVERALAWLATVQKPSGGWASNSWSEADANSTAVIIQALIATDKLTDPAFTGATSEPQLFLSTLQITDAEDESDRGSFRFVASDDTPNLMASVQAVPALASKPLVFIADRPQVPGTSTTTTVPTDAENPGSDTGGVGSGAGNVPLASERPIRFAG